MSASCMNFLLITVVEGEGIEAVTEIEENIRVAPAAVMNVEEVSKTVPNRYCILEPPSPEPAV